MDISSLNLLPKGNALSLIEQSLRDGVSDSENRILLSDGKHEFPFVLRAVTMTEVEGECTLSGVADTLSRGRHHAIIAFSLIEGRGMFL